MCRKKEVIENLNKFLKQLGFEPVTLNYIENFSVVDFISIIIEWHKTHYKLAVIPIF